MPLTFITVVPGISALKVVTVPLSAFFLFSLFFSKERAISFNSGHLCYVLHLLYMTSTLFFYRDLESITVVRDVAFALFFTLLATCRVYNQLERRLLSHTWLLVGLICMFLCFFSKQTLYEGRTAIVIFDSEEDPNFFCMYFIFPMLFALEAWMQGRHRLHWPLLYCILLFYAVLRTGSRGGLVALVSGAFAYILVAVRKSPVKRNIFPAVLLVGIVVWTISIWFLPEALRSRYHWAQILADQGSGRFSIWSYLLGQICTNASALVHGFGICSTAGQLTAAGFLNTYAHNQWIQTLFDQGLLGLFFYAALMGACLFRNVRKQPLFACGLIATLVCSFPLSFYTNKPYLNVFMMCCMTFSETSPMRANKTTCPPHLKHMHPNSRPSGFQREESNHEKGLHHCPRI